MHFHFSFLREEEVHAMMLINEWWYISSPETRLVTVNCCVLLGYMSWAIMQDKPKWERVFIFFLFFINLCMPTHVYTYHHLRDGSDETTAPEFIPGLKFRLWPILAIHGWQFGPNASCKLPSVSCSSTWIKVANRGCTGASKIWLCEGAKEEWRKWVNRFHKCHVSTAISVLTMLTAPSLFHASGEVNFCLFVSIYCFEGLLTPDDFPVHTTASQASYA